MSNDDDQRQYCGLVAHSRRQSAGEEIANSLSHGVGLVAVLIGMPVLLVAALRHNNGAMLVGGCVFSVAMILTYLSSTLYHALPTGKAKHMLRVVDHAAIFLLIAGTYTPIALGVLKGAWGWATLGVVWLIAVVGIVLKLVGGIKHPWVSTGFYLVMGWLVLVPIRPLWLQMSLPGFLWLTAGGVAYTVGTVFYATDDRVKYGHFIWHLFVMAGTCCHFMAVLVSV
jgi:hemolysin III